MSRHRTTADPIAARPSQTVTFARSPVSVAVAVALLSLSPGWMSGAAASPTGGQVAAGAATIQQPTPQSTIVHQASSRAVLNWQSFGIRAGESVIFRQPSSSAVALNRVVGPEASVISGSLQANGHVFLLNPSGVLFSKGASVDVGGLVASTLAISNADFMSGQYVFSGGAGSGAVVNEGSIRAADGGYVALIGNQVSNSGTIVANNGSVALGAGDTMLLDFGGDGLLNLKVNTAAVAARIDSGGLIQADGGRVIMSAQAKNALTATALNVDGVVRARGIEQRNGAIFLDGGKSGVTSVSGTLDASSANAGQKGGEIRVLGDHVGLFGHANVNASGAGGGGTVLVGGDFQGKNPDVANAFRTYVGADATIKADAIANGDGGKVIVWADDWTKFYGKISARGGATGGHGGFAEVSGKGNLLFAGLVDLTALFGTTGTLLLDPRDITVQTAGTSDLLLTGDDQVLFNEPGNATDITLTGSVLATQLETANVTLQANRDITFNDVAITPASGTGSLTLRAGRSIAVNQDITLLGAFTATANDPGADATARGAGAAEFTMTAGRTISTATNNANITIRTSTGPGGDAPGTGARESGTITLAGLNAGTGHVLVANNGATAGSNIVRADGAQLITASSAALDVLTAVGGSIGLGAEPIRLTVANVEARGESGGVFLASTGGVNIGGATLGGLNGILTAPGGSILLTAAGSITTSEQLVAGAGGNVTLTATGAGSNVTTNADVVSGFGLITLQADNDVTITQPVGALIVGGITIKADNDGSGGGSVTTGAAGTIGNAGAGAILIEGVDVTLGAAVTGSSVRLRPTTAAATIGVHDATKNFNVSNAEIGQITTTGTLTIGAASNTGGLTVGTDAAVNAGAKNVELITAATLAINANGITTTGNLTFTANAMTLAGAAGTISGANVTLRPATAGNTIGVEDNSQGLSLTDAELDSIATAGILTIGSGAAGNISIGVDNPLTQNAKNFQFTTAGNIAVGANNFTTTGNVGLTADNVGNTAAITTGAGITAANTLTATADAGIALNTSATTLTATNSTSGNIVIAEATGVDLAGLTTSAGNGNIQVTTTNGSITTSGAINANGAGTVTLTAGGAGSTLTVSNPITSGSGAVQLTAVDGVTLNGATGDVTTTGGYTVIADSNADATGTYTQNNAGSAVSSGAAQITAADVDLTGTIAGGAADVTFLTSTAAATIGIEDVTKNLKLTNPELSNVSTTGTIIVGSAANTGGITIGTDAALAQSAKSFQFTTAGNIAIGANNFTTTGTVGLTADNAGNIAAISSGAGVIDAAAVTAVADAGISLNTSAATVSATNTTSGAVTVADADGVSASGSNTGGGAFSVTAGGAGNTLTVNAGNINANTGSVTLQADEMTLTGTVTGNGGVTLRANTANTAITLGAGSTGLDLTNAELQQVFTTGVLTIGSDSAPAAGTITIDGPIAGATNWTTLSLRTGAAVVDGNAAAGPDITLGNGVTQGNLAIRAATGIGSAGDALETSGGGNADGLNLAYSNPGAGGVSIANTGRLNIAAVDGLTASNGGTGATTLSSSSPLTIAADVIQVGSIDMTAGEDPGAIPGDDLTVNTGVTVRSTGGDVTLRAGDQVTLTGTALVESTNAGGIVSLVAGFNDNDTVGAINGTGRASAPNVVLDSLTGVGSAGTRLNTTADTLAARSRASGGVFVSEVDAVTLTTIGAVSNLILGGGTYDLTAGGAISLTSSLLALGGGVTLQGAGVSSTAPAAILTTAAADSGTSSGPVQITATGTGAINLAGIVLTEGASSSAGIASAGGNAIFTTNDGAISVAVVSARGGDATAGNTSGGNAGTITFSVGGGNTLTLTGDLLLRGGDATGSGNAGSASAISIAAPTRLGADLQVNARRGSGAGGATAGNITFSNTLESPGTARHLTLNTGSTTTFDGAVGGSGNPLGSIITDATGTTAINGGTVTTTEGQTYNDAVTLGAATTLTSTGSGDIAFGSTVNGAQTLAVTTGGLATFSGDVGGAVRLSSLTASGSAVNLGTVSTTGAQSYAGTTSTTLNGNLDSNTAGAITVTGPALLGAGPLTVQTAGAAATDDVIFTSTINGAQSLALNAGAGDVLVQGIIGGVTPLTGISAIGNTVSLGTLNSAGAVTLTADDMTLGPVNAGGQIVVLRNLTLGRGITLGGEPGGTLGLSVGELANITADKLRIGRNDAAAAGAITVPATVSPNVNELHLIGETISGASGGVVVPALVLEAGTTNLSNANADVITLAAIIGPAGNPFTYTGDANGVIIGTVDGIVGITTNNGNVTLATGGALRLDQPISAGTGTVSLQGTTVSNNGVNGFVTAGALNTRSTTGSTTLDSINNNVATYSGQANTAGSIISFVDTNGFDVSGIAAAGSEARLLAASGAITQTGTVVAGQLSVVARDSFAFSLAGNDIGTLSASITGANQTFSYRDSNAYTVGLTGLAPAGANAVQTNAGNVTLTADTGTLTLANPIAAAGVTVALNATAGAIVQNTGAGVTADTLTGSAGTSAMLDGNNAITNLAAFTTNGAFTLNDGGGLNVTGPVTTQNGGPASIATSGMLAVTTGSVAGAGVALTTTAGGDIALNGAVNGNAGDVALVSAGNITQTATGLVNSTGALTGSAATTAILDQANTLSSLGPFTTSGNFTLNDTTGGLTLTGALNAGTAAVAITTTGGVLALQGNDVSAVGGVALQGSGVTSTGGTISTVAAENSGTASGAVQISAMGTGAIDLAGALISRGANNNAGAGSSAGNVALTTNNASISVANVDARGGDGTGGNVDGGNAGTIALNVGGANTLTLSGDQVSRGGDASGTGNAGAASAFNVAAPTRLGAEVRVVTRRGVGAGGAADGAVTFGATLDSATATARNLAITTAAPTTFAGAIGATNALASLTVNGGGTTAFSGGAVTTTGAQTYSGPVTLGANTTLASTGGGAITAGSTVNGAFALAANTSGATTFVGPIGNTATLASLATDAGGATALNGGSVTTTGAQTYGDALTFGADTVLISTGSGAITLGAGANGAFALAANTAGTTTLGGAIGDVAALTSLTTDAGGTTALNGSGVITSGNQTYNDAVTLGANPTLTSTSGNVTFANTVDADAAANNRVLTVNASAGTVTFSGNVGATQALADLDVTAGPTTIVFNGAPSQTVNVSAQGGNTATFNGPVLLATNLTVVSDGAADNNVTFGGTVDADDFANNRTLTVSSGTASTTFGAAVGATQELGALSISAGQVAFGGNVSVSGGGAVDLSNVMSVSFPSGVTIDTDRTGGATAAGDVRFNAASFTNTNAVNAGFAIDASADNGAAAGDAMLGTIGNANRLDQLAVLGDTVTFSGPVSARQVSVTANTVVTPTGEIRAAQPFDNNASDANAALLLRGLSGPGQFGTRDAPIQIDAPGLFVVIPNMPNSLPFVFLAGDPNKSPVYQFANDPTHRRVFYNGAAPDSPADRAAQGAITQQLRTLLDELAIAGFAKENIRKQLLQGIVLETGLARPGIDEFEGEGVAPPASCEPDAKKAAGGALNC